MSTQTGDKKLHRELTVRAIQLIVVIALTHLAMSGRLAAQTTSGAQDTIPPGTGISYWGVIPPPADSVLQTFRNNRMPVWEGMLVWPYRVISFPVRLVGIGIGESVEALDESKVLYHIGRLLGPRQGPFGAMMQFQAGGLSGFGGGVALEHDSFLGESNRARLYGTTTINGTHRVSLGFRFYPSTAGEIDLGAGYRVRPNARYFGIGPESESSARSFYRQELAWAGTSYRHRIAGGLSIGGDVLYSSIGTGLPEDDDDPPITDVFAGSLPLGYGSTSQGVSLGAVLSYTTALETGRPTNGGSLRIRTTYFRGNGDTEFWTYRADLQQFIRLWYPSHVLALRALGSWISPVGASPVPFQRLMTNDDPDLLRGFNDFRWRDRGLAVISAEYRWPLWVLEQPDATGLDLYLLSDVGHVFSHPNRIDVDDLTFTYGAGLRLLSAQGFVLRFEYARSNEGGVWRLRGDQIFQFARGGLFHGRDPIPTR